MTKKSDHTLSKNMLIFRKLGISTIFSVYLLILVGGVVRSTGAGMGCPDWPRCFGQWIPPTSAEELPEDYKDIYGQKRAQKNARLAKMIEQLGFSDLAIKIRGDAKTYEEADFNALKTWIEYLNRLLGAIIGLLILGTFFYSFSFYRINTKVTVYSFLALILVLVQAWIGSIVVSTNLLAGMISIHMLLAIVIVSLLIYAVSQAMDLPKANISPQTWMKLRLVLAGAILISLAQVLMGTQVREGIDAIARALGPEGRGEWVENSGAFFYIHRSFSWLVLISNMYLIYLLRKTTLFKSRLLRSIAGSILMVLILEITSGASMAYFGIPAFLQPLHLLLGVLLLGAQFFLWQIITKVKQAPESVVIKDKELEVN